jgi:hypothetical protein
MAGKVHACFLDLFPHDRAKLARERMAALVELRHFPAPNGGRIILETRHPAFLRAQWQIKSNCERKTTEDKANIPHNLNQ